MSLRHKASCVDPQFTAPKQNVNGAPRTRFLWDRPHCNDATGVSLSKDVGADTIASPQDGQQAKVAQQHTQKGSSWDVSFSGAYAPLRCSQNSPAVLSLVLQQAMAVADLAQRNLLECEGGCTLRSCRIDDRQRNGRRCCAHAGVDAATAESMLKPFHSHMHNMAKATGDAASSTLLQAYAGGHNPIVLSLKNHPVEVASDALNCLDKAPLEPYACAKDVKYYLITPANTKAEAAQFVASTADTYRQCSLGKHSPAPGSLLFPDAPVLPLSSTAESQTKELRRFRTGPTSSSKGGGPPLLVQESLKRSLQRSESLHPSRNASNAAAAAVLPASSPAAGLLSKPHVSLASPSEQLVKDGRGDAPAPQLPLQVVPFKVPDGDDPSSDPYPPVDGQGLAAADAAAAVESHEASIGQSSQDSAEKGVPEWYGRSLCRVCYQLQRRLLLDGQDDFPRRSLRSLHSPAVVVYVVVPSDSIADVSRALLLCSQALAPCTSLGLEEAQQQCSADTSATGQPADDPDASSTAGADPLASAAAEGASAYACGHVPRKVALGSSRPWPSILHSIDACPTKVVLQAITPSMLRDATTCSVRSTAFAVYNKVALAEQGGASAQQHPPRAAAGEVKGGPGATATDTAQENDSAGQNERHTATDRGLRHRRRWVECCAAFPPFKLAQVDLGPAIQPPAIEEGQEPQGWLEEFRREPEPAAEPSPAGGSPPTAKGHGPDSPAVLGGKASNRQMQRSGSFLSQPISPLSMSPLPFSDSESSGSDSLSGSRSRARVSLTPVHNTNASAVANSVRPEALGRSGGRPVAGVTKPTLATNSGDSVWTDEGVLHCTYTVGSAEHGTSLVTMAWADANGELLHQATEELLPHAERNSGGSGSQQEGIMLAWWCAERLIGATLDLMARSAAAAALQHMCVTLVVARDCEHWVWMHAPQLLAAQLQRSAALAQQLKRVTVLNVAIDDPTLIRQPQIHCEGADKAGMHIVYPGLRPMFHEHVESRAMQGARLRRAGLSADQPETAKTSAAGVHTPPHRESKTENLANGARVAAGTLTAEAPSGVHSNGYTAHVEQAKLNVHQPSGGARSPMHMFEPSALGGKPRPLNGVTSARASPSRHADISPKPADAWSGACDGPSNSPNNNDVAPAASPADVTFAGFPSSNAAVGDAKHAGSDGNKSQKDVEGDIRSQNHLNGKILDVHPSTPGAGGAMQAVARKRSRDDGAGQAATQAGGSPAGGAAAAGRPATASVLWLPVGGRAELGDGRVQHTPLRAMHVAVLCQWSVAAAGDSGVDVQWVAPSCESVVAAARALHRLAFLHWCHWGFAMQAHRTFLWGGPGPGVALPRVAHWPIHCALAARACRLAQQVTA
eukprot:jgi/Ulvmu1/12838/UM098_0023.1